NPDFTITPTSADIPPADSLRFEITAHSHHAARTYFIIHDNADPIPDSVFVQTAEPLATPGTEPSEYTLEQNFPNPFNPATKISFNLPSGEFVTLKIYDALGREVATIVNEHRDAGSYQETFDAARLASGLYTYRLRAGSFMQTRKMMIAK